MTDIVERLRQLANANRWAGGGYTTLGAQLNEAADYIERAQLSAPADSEVEQAYRAGKTVGKVLSAADGKQAGEAFQARVQHWMMACFGPKISADRIERNHRFLEEALELVQACGCTQHESHQLVDYVYGRSDGDINQEVGGVMVTLAALCLANGFDMHAAAEAELIRIWGKIETIRAKQAAKPRHSPLPEAAPPPQAAMREALKLLREARQYVRDAGSDDDNETHRNSIELLVEIDAALSAQSAGPSEEGARPPQKGEQP